MSTNRPSASIGTKSNKQPRTISSLQEQLDRQISYLDRSAQIFDLGFEDEAPRLATSLRVLLHDTAQSHSLLKQLGIKDRMQYVDTGLYRDRLNAELERWIKLTSPGHQIVAIQPGQAGLVIEGQDRQGKPAWVAPLGRARLPKGHPASAALLVSQPFDPWWTTPLVEASSQKLFSRQNLILIMANQDGGAHVDAGLDADYADLCVDFLGVQWAEGDHVDNPDMSVFTPFAGNVAAASVRQIAYELLESLKTLHTQP